MLIQIAKAASTAAIIPDKQIALQGATGSALMYEVPVGRKFSGVFAFRTNYGVIINGVLVLYHTGSASSFAPFVPVTLVAGTKITSNGSYYDWSMFGVETNA